MLDFGGVTWKYRKYGNLLWHAWIRANQNAKKRNKKPNYLNWGANLATIDVAYKIASLLMKGFKSQMCESNWHHFWKTARWTKYSLGCPPSPIIVTSKILTFLGLKNLNPNRLICHTEHTHTPAVRPHSGWRAMTAPGTTWISGWSQNQSKFQKKIMTSQLTPWLVDKVFPQKKSRPDDKASRQREWIVHSLGAPVSEKRSFWINLKLSKLQASI